MLNLITWCSSELYPGTFIFFLVHLNDLPESLTKNATLFTDDTSLFLVVHDAKA